jgi:hypothetical protein
MLVPAHQKLGVERAMENISGSQTLRDKQQAFRKTLFIPANDGGDLVLRYGSSHDFGEPLFASIPDSNTEDIA